MTRYCSLRFTHLSGLMAPFWKDISELYGLTVIHSIRRPSRYRFATFEGSKTKYVWKGRINVQPLYYQSELWALCTNGFRGSEDER